MAKVSTGVFERAGSDTVSANAYYGALTASVLWGLILTVMAANMAAEAKFVPTGWEIFLYGIVIPFTGIFIARSDNPFLSFLGYNMIVIPFGAILGPVVNNYSPQLIRNVFAMTAMVAFIMGFAGTVFPDFFAKLGSMLFVALIGLVVLAVMRLFVPALAELKAIDYFGAALFSLYIGYDMYRAHHIPKTVNNAIDVSISLYLDVINLFLYLLNIADD